VVLAREMEGKRTSFPLSWERFQGYGAMGLPFASGHVLAFRRMTASSIGSPYTAIWHREPSGLWTMYVDQEPEGACPRFFGNAVDRVVVAEIGLKWEGSARLSLRVPEHHVQWGMRLSWDRVTRALSRLSGLLPRAVWRHRWAPVTLGRLVAPLLRVGNLPLAGRTPNGQHYRVAPRVLFRIDASAAVLAGHDLGPQGPLTQQARVGDFWIPNRGLFAFGEAAFESFNPTRHSRATTRWTREDLWKGGESSSTAQVRSRD
jgi:hypothetical protein